MEWGVSDDEWHEGVLRAERPALRAMCRRGVGGRERRDACDSVKVWASVAQRLGL